MVATIANAEAGSSVRTKLNTLIDGYNGAWANVKTEFGAVGDGVADDTTSLQAAIVSNRRVYFPSGRYKVTAPLEYLAGFHWTGESGPNASSGGTIPFVEVFSTFGPEPMIHPRDVWVGVDGVAHIGASPQRGLSEVVIENMRLSNSHVDGQVGYFRYMISPSRIIGCTIACARRGLSVTAFDALIQACRFSGYPNANLDLDDYADIEQSWALAVSGEIAVTSCFFQGGFTGLAMAGRGCNATNLRFETRPLAILLGCPNFNDDGLNDGQTDSVDMTWYRSYVRGVKFEANDRDIVFRKVGAGAIVEDLNSDGTTGAPSGRSRQSITIRSTEPPTTIRNAAMGGSWDGPVLVNAGLPINLENVTCTGAVDTADQVGTSAIFTPRLSSAEDTHYQHISAPNDIGWNTGALNGRQENSSLTAFHNLQLRGLKGLNVTKKTVQPQNFGDLVAVTETATTHAVAFALAPVRPTFNAFTTVSGGALAQGTYRYAVAGVWRNGEAPVSALAGTSYKEITVTSPNLTVRITIQGSGNSPYVRIYRTIVNGGDDQWQGFWHLARSALGTFDDVGQAMDGEGGPAVITGYNQQSMQEDDADYAIVATPSWGTTCWITAKATTGFTINFGTAAPASATVQWLLFRP